MKRRFENRMTKNTWDDWKESNESSLDIFNGNINAIRYPNWYSSPNRDGLEVKGRNVYDFSGIHLKDVMIHNAFAEGLNIQKSVFEDVYFDDGDFSRANFCNCQFINTKFNKTIFTDANFNGATFINCNLNRVNLTNAKFQVKEIKETVIYGISAWDIEISEDSIQSKLVIEKTYSLYSEIIAEGRIPLMVDNIELAQFIYYLSNHKKLRDTINILNNRGVLLLGKFKDGGLERLYKLRDWFSDQNYLPMIFDFDRPSSLDYTETIVTLSGLSKLVVADLSGDSVPQELHAILTNFVKPVIVYHDKVAYSMLKDLKRKNKYFHDIKFDGTEKNLLTLLPAKLKEAETDFRDIIIDLAKEYD
jgi:uncharacterized protein YjbI with pentapeptide repeats